MPAPRAAIIIPAYNAADYIEASVRSILGQSVADFTLIVVNDGSTDETGAILARLAAEDRRLLPLTVASLRAALGSAAPFDILPAVWAASLLSVTAGLLAERCLRVFS